jgi:hypothetical protein
MGATIAPDKTDPPLIIDPDTVLSFSISRKSFQPVPRWNPEIFDICTSVQHSQLPERRLLNVGRICDSVQPTIVWRKWVVGRDGVASVAEVATWTAADTATTARRAVLTKKAELAAGAPNRRCARESLKTISRLASEVDVS